ncbi:peroxisomal membrane protein PEX13 [Pseudomyrmex gracilis]|uniref:peroxisomal membrane protein PEX13 n=1 Tax=Pseudomyrmex gracilis TaxID=219809 RepID=UPI0009949F41|nr:peroxisomal membrane protein PEX13 [Pseudomyrmex gracilis]
MAPGNNILNSNQLRNSNISSSLPGSSPPFQPTGAIPPPLPPRQSVDNYVGYRPYNSTYNYGNFGYGGGYRGYGGYGSFGSYLPYSGNSYGSIGGYSGDAEHRFQQYLEESTRSTFSVVETILHTFSSITMLLDSTYFALTSSFRAILSVADNIGKLRSTIGQLFSTFALLRVLKWAYRKVLMMLGVQTQSAISENLWQQSVTQVSNGEQILPGNGRISPFVNFLIFGVFVSIPFLIHKLSNSLRLSQIRVDDPKEWVKCEDPVCVATAIYDFTSLSSGELNLRAGQKIWLAPRSLQPKNSSGWWLATDSASVGLVPANYVTIVGQLKKKTELKNNGNDTSPLISTSVENAAASTDSTTYVNTFDSSANQKNTDFSENNIKDELFETAM